MSAQNDLSPITMVSLTNQRLTLACRAAFDRSRTVRPTATSCPMPEPWDKMPIRDLAATPSKLLINKEPSVSRFWTCTCTCTGHLGSSYAPLGALKWGIMKRLAIVLLLLFGTVSMAHANNAKISPELQGYKPGQQVQVIVQYAPGNAGELQRAAWPGRLPAQRRYEAGRHGPGTVATGQRRRCVARYQRHHRASRTSPTSSTSAPTGR